MALQTPRVERVQNADMMQEQKGNVHGENGGKIYRALPMYPLFMCDHACPVSRVRAKISKATLPTTPV